MWRGITVMRFRNQGPKWWVSWVQEPWIQLLHSTFHWLCLRGEVFLWFAEGSIYFSLASPKGRSISVVVLGFNPRGKPVERGVCHKILIITPGFVSLQKRCLVGF